jgi:hypothetical protein
MHAAARRVSWHSALLAAAVQAVLEHVDAAPDRDVLVQLWLLSFRARASFDFVHVRSALASGDSRARDR